jgi:hypothetical protein
VIFDEHADEKINLAVESAPDEKLKLVPTFRLFYHTYPVCRYYLDVTRKKAPELPFEKDSYCVVTRNNYRLSLLEIKAAQYHFLERLVKEDSIAKAKEYFVNIYGFDAKRLDKAWQQWRKSFISAGFFHILD